MNDVKNILAPPAVLKAAVPRQAGWRHYLLWGLAALAVYWLGYLFKLIM